MRLLCLTTKTPRFLSAKQKAKKRRATRQAQRHNRKSEPNLFTILSTRKIRRINKEV